MSTGGNVPSQGATQEALSPQRKRGDRGILGKGTCGKRLKAYHRRDNKLTKQYISLRDYARRLASDKTAPEAEVKDAIAWLDGKTHPPKRVPKPKAEKTVESKGTINVPKKAARR